MIAVNHPQAGIYCIGLDPSIDPTTAVLVATPEYYESNQSFSGSSTTSDAIVVVAKTSYTCPAGELRVLTGQRTFSNGAITGNPLADEAFFFIVG